MPKAPLTPLPRSGSCTAWRYRCRWQNGVDRRAAERRGTGDIGERGRRRIDLHERERAGLEGEAAGKRSDVPAAPLPGVKIPLMAVLPTVPVPAPLSEPNVLSKPFKSSVAPPATVKTVLAPNAPALPSRSVPAFTLVAPV